MKGNLGAVVKLLPCDHEVIHGFKSWKRPLAEMQGKTVYIRPKVVGPCTGLPFTVRCNDLKKPQIIC
jgi:hypothetical protein